MASSLDANLPLSVRQYLTGEDWKGGPLVDLSKSGSIRTPTAKEISVNYYWLRPLVEYSPRKAMFARDIHVELHDRSVFFINFTECRSSVARTTHEAARCQSVQF